MSSDLLQAITECSMVKNIPTGISGLLAELTNEEADIDHLISLLEKFPVVCVRIVMVANSAWAAPKAEITDVKRACMQLGLKMVKSISIALLVSQQFNVQNCKGFSERKFWLGSLVTADLMQMLQKKSNLEQTDSSTAHLIGLIHNLGLLAIADIAPEKVSQAIIISDNSEVKFSDALVKTVGISYLEVTQVILYNWGLPNTLSHAFYDSPNQSIYRDILAASMVARNQLNINALPIDIVEGSEQLQLIHEEIVSKSDVYDELCGMYCR